MVLAWHVAALERQKKLPELHTLLANRGRQPRQTLEEQRAVVHALSAQLGIPVRRVRMIRREVTH